MGFIFCRSSPSACFLPSEDPSAFVAKPVWWGWILLTFAFFWKAFDFCHQIWRRVLLSRVFLVAFSSLPSVNILCHFLLVYRVFVEKSAHNLMGVPLYIICHFLLVAFNILSLRLYLFPCLGSFSYYLFKYFLKFFSLLLLWPL